MNSVQLIKINKFKTEYTNQLFHRSKTQNYKVYYLEPKSETPGASVTEPVGSSSSTLDKTEEILNDIFFVCFNID